MKPDWNLWFYRLTELRPAGIGGLALLCISLAWTLGSTIPAFRVAQQISSDQKMAAAGVARGTQSLQTVDIALRQLFAAARANGVRIERGEYSVAEKGSVAPSKIVLNMPVRGDYPGIRKFLSQSLNDNPGLVLEQIRLSRPQAGQSDLAGSVRFTLQVRSPR